MKITRTVNYISQNKLMPYICCVCMYTGNKHKRKRRKDSITGRIKALQLN